MPHILIALFALFIAAPAMAAETKTAIFAGGCFWCMESEFETEKGVLDVEAGYTGGDTANPSYAEVSKGDTGHREAIRVTYDPAVTGYKALLSIFWSNVDFEDDDGQFCDKGFQYTSAIFYGTPEEQALAEEGKNHIEEKRDIEVKTMILPAKPFYRAEESHQDFYKKQAARYEEYKAACGRDSRLNEMRGE